MTALPVCLTAIMTHAFDSIQDSQERNEIRLVAGTVAEAVKEFRQAIQLSQDAPLVHEWIVFTNAIRIAECEQLTLSGKRIAAAFAFIHDTFSIRRITEKQIREAGDSAARAKLKAEKERQRLDHMRGGASNARLILGRLQHPQLPGSPLLTEAEIDRCAEIVSGHDLWKLGRPHPLGSDRLAVVCLDADALWPLHPLGVLVDLERPDENDQIRDISEPAEWRRQLQNSLQTLLDYRANWKDVPGESFVDDQSIFRTREGHRLFEEWKRYWGLG